MLIGKAKFNPDPRIRNVLVTGAAGFIGSWLARHLVVQYPEYNVVCFDKMDYCSTEANLDVLKGRPNYHFVIGDITDRPLVEKVIRENEIDTILNLAAESSVELSFENGILFTYNNVIGTQTLLEVCRSLQKPTDKAAANGTATRATHESSKDSCSNGTAGAGSGNVPENGPGNRNERAGEYTGIHRFIQMSTDEVYGEISLTHDQLAEDAPLEPTNPYSASKAAADLIVAAYSKSFNIPCIKVRCNNVYGPYQYPEKIIPKFILMLHRGLKCTLHGDGHNYRRYLYAADAIDGIDAVLHRGQVGKTYNIGTTDELSNLELAKQLLTQFGYDPENSDTFSQHVQFSKDRVFNDLRYAIDSSQIRSLGWRQSTSFEEGLADTVKWYRQYGDNWWGDIDDWLVSIPTKKLT